MNEKQQEIIDKISDKIVFGKMTPKREKELLNNLYETIEEIVEDLLLEL
jgi:hypothetical protein